MADDCKVLIVENDWITQRLLIAQFHALHCEVTLCGTGAEAIAHLEKGTFALLLLDLNLPDMDGYRVAERARANTSRHPLRIVAMTASNRCSDRAGLDAARIDACLTKPIDMTRLQEHVVAWI